MTQEDAVATCRSSPTGRRTGAGETVDGVMEAADARAVVERLQREAYFPIRVAAAGRARRPARWAAPALRQRRVRQPRRPRLHPAAGHPRRGRAAARPRPGHPGRAGAHAARCARSSPTCCTACAAARRWPTRWPSTTRGRSRACTSTWCGPARRAACSRRAAPAGRVPRGAREFREAVVSALIYPVAAHGVGAAAVIFLHDLRHPALRRHLRGPRPDDPAAHPDPPRASAAVVQRLLVGCWRSLAMPACWPAAWLLATPRGRLGGDRLAAAAAASRARSSLKIEMARFARDPRHAAQERRRRDPGALAVVGEMLTNQVARRAVVGAGRRRQARRPGWPGPWPRRRRSRPWPSTWCAWARRPAGSRRCCSGRGTFEADTRKLVKRLIAPARARHHPGHGRAWWASSWWPCCWRSSPSTSCPL